MLVGMVVAARFILKGWNTLPKRADTCCSDCVLFANSISIVAKRGDTRLCSLGRLFVFLLELEFVSIGSVVSS